MGEWILELPDQFNEGHRAWYSVIEWTYDRSERRLAKVVVLGPIGSRRNVADEMDPAGSNVTLRYATEDEILAKIAETSKLYGKPD